MAEIKTPRLDKLHDEAMAKLKEMEKGVTREGFAALVDAARYLATAEICAAVRADLRNLPSPSKE